MYMFEHDECVYDIFIGRDQTPLESRILSISGELCRISDLETGTDMEKVFIRNCVRSMTIDETQNIIAIGTEIGTIIFIDTKNFIKVKEVSLDSSVLSLAFNKRNDCLLAVTKSGDVYGIKFR